MADEPAGPMSAMLRRLGDLQDRVDGFETQLGELAELPELVVNLRHDIENLATETERSKPPQVWQWPALTQGEAQRKWAVLRDWMRATLLPRYPETAAAIMPCWYRHPWTLDVITALYVSWVKAYESEDSGGDDAALWQEQRLPNATKLIRDSLGSCRRNECALTSDDGRQRAQEDKEDLDAKTGGGMNDFIREDLRRRTGNDQAEGIFDAEVVDPPRY